MQVTVLIWSVFIVLMFVASSGDDTAESDPYSTRVVKFELKMRADRGKFINSATQKQLHRLGDGVSIALIKILGEADLVDPKNIKSFLPMIQDAFAYPDLIARDMDKKPTVTMVLLKYLGQTVTDTETQKEIQETMAFVKRHG
ncbi:MAG TPA: hypothetical protein VG488_00200 [Candidatus Angelobacter sp.]|nr:hypothetical protein [Candidatus Angelobacter sp.]